MSFEVKNMNNREVATYLGKEYEAYISRDEIVLYSTDLQDISKGFKECKVFRRSGMEKDIVCKKIVQPSEVDSCYFVATKAICKDYCFPLNILTEKYLPPPDPEEKDMLLIDSSDCFFAKDMGMTMIERGFYAKWIKKEEVKLIVEIKGWQSNDIMKAIWQLMNLETKEMKTGTFAIYLGKTYITTTDEKGNILLHSTDLEDCSNGFELCEPFQILGIKEDIVCTKSVELSDLDFYFKVKTEAMHGSKKIDIVEGKGKMLFIMGIEKTFKAVQENNKLTFIDEKEIPYQKWLEEEELSGIRLEIEELTKNQEIENIWRLLNIDVENKKHNTYVAYLGKAYAANTTLDGNFVLYSTNAEDVSKGFEQCKPFKMEGGKRDITYVKYVKPSEISSYFKVRIVAEYQGYEFEVVEEKDKMLSIITIYEDGRIKDERVWEGIGMVAIDKYKNIHQKWIRKDEVTKIKYEIKELLNNVKMENEE